MKVLIANPPWINDKRFGHKRRGVRAGSRWPFTSRSELFTILLSKLFSKTPQSKSKSKWAVNNIFTNPLAGLKTSFDILRHRRVYTPYPLFMGYAAGYLLSKGIETKFYDAIAWGHNYKTFYKTIDRFRPDIVIQETSTPSFEIDLEIARELHKKHQVCLVGPHSTAFAEKLIKLPFVDYILKGEYEYSALEMVQTGRKGIYASQPVTDLDSLPYPYRDKKIIPQYREYCCHKKLAFPQLWVYGSRGCAFQCDFCLWVHTMYNKKFTLRSPERILAEIEDMLTKYNFKYILFDDDCWNLGGDKRLTEIADGLHKIGLPWSVLARLDTCSKETFKYLIDKGCVGLRLGVESLSQNLLNKTNKKLKVEFILDILNYLKSLDVSLYLCFMHYILGETETDRKEQNRWIKNLDVPYQNPPCIPFPGTPYYNRIKEKGFDLEKNISWSEYDGGKIGRRVKDLVKAYTELTV